jgi:hypothetical protein
MARHEHTTDWRTLAFYGMVSILVVLIGAAAIWSFVERQSLVIAPEPLPKVTIVTEDPRSRLGAAWVNLLTSAELPATLVPLEHFDPIEGVVVLCDIERLPKGLPELLNKFTQRGGVVAFVGRPPLDPIGRIKVSADAGTSDAVMRFSEALSPALARLNPGYEVGARRGPVHFLNETPRTTVDVRWRESARAAIAHWEVEGTRVLWFGFDPDALASRDDRQLKALLRTSFRWVAGQPVSDGACGAVSDAKTLTPAARRLARSMQLSFSVDPLPKPGRFSIRMTNRGKLPIENPTVKVWLPANVTSVNLGGDYIMNRHVTLIGVPEEGAALVSLPTLGRNEERIMKLEVATVRRLP